MYLHSSFCTVLLSLICGYSRLFIPKVDSCAAFHVILPFASIGFSSGHLIHLKVTVSVFKVLALSLKKQSQTSFQQSSLNGSEEKCFAFEFQGCSSKRKVYPLKCTGQESKASESFNVYRTALSSVT